MEVPCLRPSVQTDFESSDSPGDSRRLRILREQLLRENRRSAGPFSHPLAAHGPLWRLREQIRDVSRIADAVVASAELASDARMTELCSDLRCLLQTQQSWTERLENQIWRLESQTMLLKRLQQVLLHGSPGTDHLWQLCELIARETQAIPDGLLLLPEPGQRITLPVDGIQCFAAMSIELARFSVFAAMSLLPDVRGAEIVAGSLLASASRVTKVPSPETETDTAMVSARLAFAEMIVRQTAAHAPVQPARQLIQVATDFTSNLEQESRTVTDSIVPPGIKEFYSVAGERWRLQLDEADQQMAQPFLDALRISTESPSSPHDGTKEQSKEQSKERTRDGDDRLVLAYKLRWHDGGQTQSPVSSEKKLATRIRRRNSPGEMAERPTFSVFTEFSE